MKLNLTLLLLTLMTLMVLSHALTIDKRGEDEDEPDEDEPDENEGGPPPPPSHHPQQQLPPKVKPVIEHVPKPIPPVVAAPPTKSPSQEHHEEHSSPKKAAPEPETVLTPVVPAIPSVQVEPTYPLVSPSVFSNPAPSATDLLMPTLSTEASTVSSVMPESTDLPPLGIASNANLSFFTPSSISVATMVFGSTMIVSFWL